MSKKGKSGGGVPKRGPGGLPSKQPGKKSGGGRDNRTLEKRYDGGRPPPDGLRPTRK